jgi:hypothetical protein
MPVTGIMQRFKGKVKAHALLLGPGGLIDGTTGIKASAVVAQRLAMTVTAVANTDFTMSVPPGASITSIKVFTGTAFTAVTDAQLSVGVSAGDASYVALTSIKALGLVNMALVAAAAAALASAPAGSPNLFIRIVQTGTPSAVGAATLVVDYVMV